MWPNDTIIARIADILSALKQKTDTAKRYNDALKELLSGEYEERPLLKTFPSSYKGIIYKGNIKVASLCPHHLLPYLMAVHVAYWPSGTVIGISKIARLVRWHAARFTLQEDLTASIATDLGNALSARVSMCLIDGLHLCEAIRGARSSATTTTINIYALSPTEGPTTVLEQQFMSLIASDRQLPRW